MTKTLSSRIISSSMAWLSASRTVYRKKKGVISIATLLSKSCQNYAARASSDFCTHCTRQRLSTEADSTHHHSDAFVGAGSPLLAVADQEPGCAPGDFGCGGGEEGIPGDELCAGAGGGGGGGGEGRGVGPEGAGDAACDPGSHGRFARGIGGGGERDLWIYCCQRRPPTTVQRAQALSDPRAPFRHSSICFPYLFHFIPPPPCTFTNPLLNNMYMYNKPCAI